MTALLDDAAERRIRYFATTMTAHPSDIFLELLRKIWTEATEAAALKCDQAASDYLREGGRDMYTSMSIAAEVCAAAIRGGKL